LTRNINLFLFIFNMIPIPGFDGFTVFTGLWKIIGL
jgi:Zn-dependent protease